jgi:hypothetical protein
MARGKEIKTGHRYVYLDVVSGRYSARTQYKGVRTRLGTYDTIEEATDIVNSWLERTREEDDKNKSLEGEIWKPVVGFEGVYEETITLGNRHLYNDELVLCRVSEIPENDLLMRFKWMIGVLAHWYDYHR